MRYPTPSTLFLIAILALSTGASAQKIYKCGTTYSQQACPDGIVIPATAPPEAAQKKAADQATRRDALTADRMEKSRLQQEKEDLAANTPKIRPPVRAIEPDAKPPSLSIKVGKSKPKEPKLSAVVVKATPSKKQGKKQMKNGD